MTVIDLTLNEDTEDESCSKPNPNEAITKELLKKSNTNLMGILSHRQPKELKFNTPIQETWIPNQSECSFLFSNIKTQNGRTIPATEQMRFATKYNGWMRQYRTYNGFRLYVRQNYMKAQAYAIKLNKPDKTFVQSTLMNWWNDLDELEKNNYIKNANFMLTKRSDILENNPRIKKVDSSNVPISFSLPKHSPKNNCVGSTVNEKKQLNDICATERVEKMQADTTLHSPKP